jgi:hypothetical protein
MERNLPFKRGTICGLPTITIPLRIRLPTLQFGIVQKKEVPDTLVGNRMYNADVFRSQASHASDKELWRPASNLPGYAGRKGLSASIVVTDPNTQKKYIVIFFVPFKRIMTNTVKVGYKKGDVFIFRTDSPLFQFRWHKRFCRWF